jgi:hypothetical protein
MVRSQSGTLVIIDAGTGAAVLGRELVAAGGKAERAYPDWPYALGSYSRIPVLRAWCRFASPPPVRRYVRHQAAVRDSHMAPRGATLLD